MQPPTFPPDFDYCAPALYSSAKLQLRMMDPAIAAAIAPQTPPKKRKNPVKNTQKNLGRSPREGYYIYNNLGTSFFRVHFDQLPVLRFFLFQVFWKIYELTKRIPLDPCRNSNFYPFYGTLKIRVKRALRMFLLLLLLLLLLLIQTKNFKFSNHHSC